MSSDNSSYLESSSASTMGSSTSDSFTDTEQQNLDLHGDIINNYNIMS